MTDPILVDLDRVESEIRGAAKMLKPRLRVFLYAFLPALFVALVGRHLTVALVATAIWTATIVGLNELDPAVPWSTIGDAISRIYRGRP